MPALEPLPGVRVVADPGALDGARWSGALTATGAQAGTLTVLRFAPDEAFVIGGRHVDIDDPHAIIVDERGFLGVVLEPGDAGPVDRFRDWVGEDDEISHGAVAGVPVKILDRSDHRTLVLVSVAHAATLAERLGWTVG